MSEFTSEGSRRSTRAEMMKRAIVDHVTYTLALEPAEATDRDMFMSTAWAIRDQLAERWAATQRRYERANAKRVYYLSSWGGRWATRC